MIEDIDHVGAADLRCCLGLPFEAHPHFLIGGLFRIDELDGAVTV